MAEYTIYVKNVFNETIAVIKESYKLEYFRSERSVGSLYLDLPLEKYGDIPFEIDGRLEVWRRTAHTLPQLVGDTQWLIRLFREKVDEQGINNLRVTCHDGMDLLNRRIIAYPNYNPYTQKGTEYADDMIKEIVRENFGDESVDTDRDVSDWLSIDEDFSLAPEVTLNDNIGFRIVRPVLDKICELSEAKGTYLTYDVTYNIETKKFEFKTFIGQRGNDLGSTSQKRLVLSCVYDKKPILGRALSYASSGIDALDERTFVYLGGQSDDTNAIYATVGDDERINSSPFGRYEDFLDAENPASASLASYRNEATSWLNHKSRIREINGHIEQTEAILYGRDYNFGDIVAMQYREKIYDIHLDDVQVVFDSDGSESVTIFTRDGVLTNVTEIEDPTIVVVYNHDVAWNRPSNPLYYPIRFGREEESKLAQRIKVPADEEWDVSYIDLLIERQYCVPPFPIENLVLSICEHDDSSEALGRLRDQAGVPGDVLGVGVVNTDSVSQDVIMVRFTFDPVVSLLHDTPYYLQLTRTVDGGTNRDNFFLMPVDGNHTVSNYTGMEWNLIAYHKTHGYWYCTNSTYFLMRDLDLIFKISGVTYAYP